ncbi:hypothetical protein L1987_84676 [Smallanthus sonchifolius]|uniref:Uncharacterized protein n=1 Tax=Smallanthus sonchifolius TaxID=185202 RepID=A0ACB8XTW4_9ASTR|nr:hypothetical protein L1987_84676 [Smallanthus sonchifolius]
MRVGENGASLIVSDIIIIKVGDCRLADPKDKSRWYKYVRVCIIGLAGACIVARVCYDKQELNIREETTSGDESNDQAHEEDMVVIDCLGRRHTRGGGGGGGCGGVGGGGGCGGGGGGGGGGCGGGGGG